MCIVHMQYILPTYFFGLLIHLHNSKSFMYENIQRLKGMNSMVCTKYQYDNYKTTPIPNPFRMIGI